jgi:hypothetical protein
MGKTTSAERDAASGLRAVTTSQIAVYLEIKRGGAGLSGDSPRHCKIEF